MSAQDDIDEDDLSDVSMSAETEDSDSDDDGANMPTSKPLQQVSIMQAPDATLLDSTTRKRKITSDTNDSPLDTPQENRKPGFAKRVKLELSPDAGLGCIRTPEGRLPSDRSMLPGELWHHIFTFTSPRTLGRLLRVNKIFRAYLDPTSPASSSIIASLSHSQVPLRQPEVIWQTSRRLFRPWMPNPLEGMSELDMWKLSCNFKCNFCDKRESSVSSVTPDQWHSGPGETEVRPIWAFAVRACGSCLQIQSIKEIDLLLSSSVPSPLMAALPFIFLTAELHVVASTTLQQGQPPANMQITKYYFKPHVDEIKQEFFKVKALGSGTAEEWIKGLDNRGKEKRLDLVRWERWESSGGLHRMRSAESANLHGTTAVTDTQLPANLPMRLDGQIGQGPPGVPKPPAMFNDAPPTSNHVAHPLPSVLQFPGNLPQRFDSPTQSGFNPFPRPFPTQARHERTKEEVDRLKAARRAEIERRCLLLDPPLSPNVLAHMASFQAALQIIKPFDDNAWELLKPRLLSQRADAQQREDDRAALNRAAQEKLDERLYQDSQPKEAKEFVDREWEDAQGIIRTKIGGYADEIIQDGWGSGKNVNKETTPRFAAEVLLYVRKKFYAEIAKDGVQLQANGHELQSESQSELLSRRLSLENMRWVFDTKIKPHTEQYRKELFLCNGCENFKWYAFEGVCQHYASKHTSALSSGSIIVHWRAEWPEEPPFNPEPSVGKGATVPTTSSAASYINGTQTALPVPVYGGYQTVASSMPTTSLNSQAPVYHSISGPYADPHHVPEQYPRQGPAVYAPPAPFQGYPPGFPGPPYQVQQGVVYQPYPYTGFDPSYSTAPSVAYDASQAASVYPGVNYEPPTPIQAQHPAAPPELPSHIPPIVYRTEEYKAQLQDIALIAKGLWNSTAGVKDMPGSLRVYTILYHILQRSRAKYAEDPPLKMLIDGLHNNKDMRPVRNVNGLACKTCAIERANRPINPHTVSSKGTGTSDRKLFSFPQLLNHFQSTHIENPKQNTHNIPVLDWTTDMVELPDKKKLRNLPKASGMDDYKFQLVKEALPEYFKPDTPEPEVEQARPFYSRVSREDDRELAPSKDNHERYYTKPSHPSPSPPQESGRRQDHAIGHRSTIESPRVAPSSRIMRTESFVPDRIDPAPMDYVDHRIASPTGNKRIKREIDRDVNLSDSPLYSAQGGSYGVLNENNQRFRHTRTRVLSPHLQDIPLRPEYNYEEANLLPRLIEKAGMLAKPPSPRHHERPYEARANDTYYRAEPSYRPTSYAGRHIDTQQRPRPDPRDAGSEDGEVGTQPSSGKNVGSKEASADARIAAEQFLNNILPADSGVGEVAPSPGRGQPVNEEGTRAQWAPERGESSRQAYKPEMEAVQRIHYRDEEYQLTNERPAKRNRSQSPPQMRPVTEAARGRQPQYLPYDYEEHIEAPRSYYTKHRTSEMADRRYVMDDVIYRDERHNNPDAHPRTGSRFVSYETLRYDDEVPHSRSPVYITNPDRRQYRALSPGGRHYVPQDPMYDPRPPPEQEHVAYERVPRPEYYRVYADEQPRRHVPEPQIEYVRADVQGEYVVPRPVRREQEAVYAYEEAPRYEEVQRYEGFNEPPQQRQRQPLYEDEPRRRPVYERPGPGGPVSRNDPAYYEEYDPRHPAPPPEVAQRPLRYE